MDKLELNDNEEIFNYNNTIILDNYNEYFLFYIVCGSVLIGCLNVFYNLGKTIYLDWRLQKKSRNILQTHLITKENSNQLLEQDCSVCLESFQENDPLITLSCKHTFHENCIRVWLQDNEHNNCPICRLQVL